MAKLKIFANPDYGDEMCPVCSCEFTAPFGLAVCRTCGFVSWGCNMCPLDKFKCCGDSKKCPINHNFELYAVFRQKEFDSLPDEYKIYAEKDGSAWQCPWPRKVEVRDDAWSVELTIPLADLLDTLPRLHHAETESGNWSEPAWREFCRVLGK